LRRIQLDNVLLSPRIVAAWEQQAKRAARAFAVMGIDPRSIPDEQAGVLRNGNLKIYATRPDVEISLEAPPSEWSERAAEEDKSHAP